MKKILFVSIATSILGGASLQAQTNSASAVVSPTINTSPAGVSQFQVSGRLLTQNSTPGAATLPLTDLRITGNFGVAARWNSMGNLKVGLVDTLNGFRTQTNGRALTSGHKKSGTVVSNSFIEWIGNNGITPVVTPGDLEFRWAASPTGGVSNLLFNMRPASGFAPGFAYADGSNLIGQRRSGTFGSFGGGDNWSATGEIVTPNFTTYGNRHQYQGYTANLALISSNLFRGITTVLDFGHNRNINDPNSFKFRSFSDPNNPNSIRNVWQSEGKFAQMMLGRQDINAVSNSTFYLSLFDGFAPNASFTSLNFLDRAGIYACGDGFTEFNEQLKYYAAVVGDISGSRAAGASYGVLGIANGNYAQNQGAAGGKWAGYFIGDVEITGSLSQLSDRRLKTQINDETDMMSKIMKLQPKNYLFDIEKNKNIALSNKLQHGLISQDVEEIFPELVTDSYVPSTSTNKSEDGSPVAYKGLNYIGFIPMLIKAIQEQQVQIEDLKKQLEVKSTNNTLVLTEKNSLNLPAEIENKAFSLSQNSPNPFSDRTTITYSLPTDVSKAVLGVFDLNGKMLLQFNLQAGKNQQVQVSGNTLGAGMYIYSIIADGQEVISKRMILTK